jgi:hypothetical protein
MPLKRLEAAHARMLAARKAIRELSSQEHQEHHDAARERALMNDLMAATEEFLAAADQLVNTPRSEPAK